jgi:ABC-type sulfate transport system permease component
MAMNATFMVVGIAFAATVCSLIFARPMARWLKHHTR